MKKPMIEIEHLSYGYGQKKILNDIDVMIEEGSFYALLGSNGCGKTTLLRCISNLLTPQEGRVLIDRKESTQYGARALAQKIAMVQQHAHTDMEFSAFETVLMGRNPYQHRLENESQEDWDIVERCMRQTNTWHLRLARPSEMSGGELQRVMIARALAQETPILLLDEPTSNLDIAHQFEIMELLSNINEKEHKTILIVVHDLNLALQYSPRTILLHEGRVLFQGDTHEALSPKNIYIVFGVHAIVDNNHLHLSL